MWQYKSWGKDSCGLHPYPLGSEGEPHPAYIGKAIDVRVWLKRWARMEDRRCYDRALERDYQ